MAVSACLLMSLQVPSLTPGLESASSDMAFDSASLAPAGPTNLSVRKFQVFPCCLLTELQPLDFATMFDGVDYGLPDLWDNDFLASF